MQDSGGAWFAATAASLLLAWAGTVKAGTVEFEATESRREFSVEIPGYQQVRPTIEIRAVIDHSGEPVRLTKGPALNGCTLADELLTGSILTLRPNGTGVWIYDGGVR